MSKTIVIRTTFLASCCAILTACGGTSPATPPVLPPPPMPGPLPALTVAPALQITPGTITVPGSTATITTSVGYNAITGDPAFNAFVNPAAGAIIPFSATGGTASYTGSYTVFAINDVTTDANNQVVGTGPVTDTGDFTAVVTLTSTPTLTGSGGGLTVNGTLDNVGFVSGTATYNGITGRIFNSAPLDATQITAAVSGGDATGGFAGGFTAVAD